MKKILFPALLLVCSNVWAAPTTINLLTPAQIQASQNGAVFTDWRTPMTCSYVDNNQVIKFTATLTGGFPVLTRANIPLTDGKVDSGVAFGNFTNQTVTTPTTPPVTTTKRVYVNPTATTSTVTASVSNGGYMFTYTTTKGDRRVIVFPSGFYFNTGAGNSYAPGC